MFVTSQGTAVGRFSRAIQKRLVFQAELAARELGQLPLGFALDLVVLYAEVGDPKAERAAVRLLRRLLEERSVSLSEARRAADWLEQLAGPEADLAAGSLSSLIHRR